jgi:hypothetical protein
MSLLCGRDDFVEVGDDVVTLGFGNAHDLGHETRIEEHRLPSGNGMSANKRVLGNHRLAAHRSAQFTGSIGLHLRRMKRSESFQVLLHRFRQGVVYRILGRPERITASAVWRSCENLQ